MLSWLNDWGCRIPVLHFPQATVRLRGWHSEAMAHRWVPAPQMCLGQMSETYLIRRAGSFARLFDSLLEVMKADGEDGSPIGFGPTAASKTLFALRPGCFPAWDSEIANKLGFNRSGASYVQFMNHVHGNLQATAKLCDWQGFGLEALPEMLRPNTHATVVQLVAELYWVVLTRRVTLPSAGQRGDWAAWS
jgi:hypothetical protein